MQLDDAVEIAQLKIQLIDARAEILRLSRLCIRYKHERDELMPFSLEDWHRCETPSRDPLEDD
jgi:hypothetical protein